MRLAFLGTGAATSRDRFNSSVAVDGRLLLDAGAPLLVNLTRTGIEPDGIGCILLSHCHGDHFVGLGTFLIDRVLGGVRVCCWSVHRKPSSVSTLFAVRPEATAGG